MRGRSRAPQYSLKGAHVLATGSTSPTAGIASRTWTSGHSHVPAVELGEERVPQPVQEGAGKQLHELSFFLSEGTLSDRMSDASFA